MKQTITTQVQVRYAETDQMGVVYHANYLIWFEIGRTNYMMEKGYHYSNMEAQGLFLPVSEASMRLIAPAKYGDVLDIVTRLESVKSRKITFEYKIKKDDALLVNGSTAHICLNKAGKPTVIPQWIRDRLQD